MATIGKNVWGPTKWYELHTAAISYPVNPSRDEKVDMRIWFWRFVYVLPCVECRTHATEYASKYPPDVSGGREFQTWAWRFHNAVNSRLKKPLMSVEMYHKAYQNEIDKAYAKYL